MLRKRLFQWLLLSAIPALANQGFSQDFSFVVGADNRSYIPQYRSALQEINAMATNPAPAMPFPRFFITVGDFDPVESNMAIYNDRQAYPNLPPFYPVIGNHEFETPSNLNYVLNEMLPDLPNVVNRGKQGTYSFDYEQVHYVVLDQYSENNEGEIDPALRDWLQRDLNQTDKDHIFVFGHEPAFPRHRHVGNSLDMYPETRDAFWNTLVQDPRLRAFFCGHTHYYSRMRVRDPASVGRLDYPDQDGGRYQIDVGAIGNEGDGKLTLVYVQVYGDSLRFRTIQSPRNRAQWQVVDEWRVTDVRRYSLQLLQPQAGTEIAGVTEVHWRFTETPAQPLQPLVYISRDAGTQWDSLWTGQPGDTTFTWNTENGPDGTRYRLRVVAKNDSGFALAQTGGTFTINNPVNAVPEIDLLSPEKADLLSGQWTIQWDAADADGDSLRFSLAYSPDGGKSWEPVLSDLQGVREATWNTVFAANSAHCRLLLRASDGTVVATDTSDVFEIANERQNTIPGNQFAHVAGVSNAQLAALIIDPALLTGHRYRITFDDTSAGDKSYDVWDSNTGQQVVQKATQLDGLAEGPFFDGMRMWIKDIAQTEVDRQNSAWINGDSNLEFSIRALTIYLGDEVIKPIRYPADYKISFFEQVVDTSGNFLGMPPKPMKFTVFNVTESRPVELIFIDSDDDQSLAPGDALYLFEPDSSGEPHLSWGIQIFRPSAGTQLRLPQPDDEYLFKTLKGLSRNDVYEFDAVLTSIPSFASTSLPDTPLLFPAYPNPFNPETRIRFYLPKRKEVRLEIFDLLGKRVRRLVHGPLPAGMHEVSWNGKNDHDLPLASGLYIYRLRIGNVLLTQKVMLIK